MTDSSRKALATAILDEYGTTFSEELKIHIEHNTPSPLFELLCFALISGNRISHDKSAEAMRAIFEHGWTTVKKMVESSWEDRTNALNRAGYTRYDESTSKYLGETASMLQERYGGDLRNLREAAEHDPEKEREYLKECKGLGDTGVDIFFREVQGVWSELFPYADSVALEAARRLELGDSAVDLLGLIDQSDYIRFLDGLVRVNLADSYERVAARLR